MVDVGLMQLFDRVNHDILKGLIAENMGDERVLLLIRWCIEAGTMDGGLIRSSQEGALKPLMSNILLTKLDRELEKPKCPYELRLSKELFGSVRVADSAGESSTALVFLTNHSMRSAGAVEREGEGSIPIQLDYHYRLKSNLLGRSASMMLG